MRRKIPCTVVVLVVVILLGTQVSELFDTWDNTMQTGNDIEFSLTVIAVCIGACLLVASLLVRCFWNLASNTHRLLCPQLPVFSECTHGSPWRLLSPSPPPLRI